MKRQRKVRTFGHSLSHFGSQQTRKFMTFGNQELPIHRPEEQFYFEARQILDHIQNCLVDNIWNILSMPGTTSHKIAVINSLVSYLQTIQKIDFFFYLLWSSNRLTSRSLCYVGRSKDSNTSIRQKYKIQRLSFSTGSSYSYKKQCRA